MSITLGRLPKELKGKAIVYDAPERAVQGMLSNQDDIIDALKALCAKLDADAGVTDTNYAALISANLKKLDLIL